MTNGQVGRQWIARRDLDLDLFLRAFVFCEFFGLNQEPGYPCPVGSATWDEAVNLSRKAH